MWRTHAPSFLILCTTYSWVQISFLNSKLNFEIPIASDGWDSKLPTIFWNENIFRGFELASTSLRYYPLVWVYTYSEQWSRDNKVIMKVVVRVGING